MLKESRKFAVVMKELYETKRVTMKVNYSFEDMMKSNETRLKFLSEMFDDIEVGNLSEECQDLFEANIDFIKSFLNGDFKKTVAINKLYDDDKDHCLVIPKQSDIDYLYTLIDINMELFEAFYKDSEFMVKLPDNSFNMNMERVLNVDYYNLAHLFGLTQSEPVPDKKKNLLKKYFLQHFDSGEDVRDSVKLLNWFISKDGRKEIHRLNQLTLDFVTKDRLKNPNSYDEHGNIKEKSLEEFKKRFKSDPKNEGLDYPIIRFSRYICKCTNNLNYFNMTNITQMILDYNAPEGDNDEKDIFFVNIVDSKLSKYIADYHVLKKSLENYLKQYGKDFKKDVEIEEYLFSCLIERDSKNVDKKREEIRSFLNLYQADDFILKQGIIPNVSKIEDKLREFLAKVFDTNISLIGFGTDFKRDDKGEISLTELDEYMTNSAHCDTSIFVNPADLVDKYYKKGRSFFIDKIYSDPEGTGYIRISNPCEEMEYLRMTEYYEEQKEASEKFETLNELFNNFNEKYHCYTDTNRRGKGR